jgi:transcriptional regulator with XRE-family HTH domain
MTITGAQVKAARTLLGWTQHRTADELRIRLSEFARLEAGKSQLTVFQMSVLKRVLERAGVAFEDDGRVTLREGK